MMDLKFRYNFFIVLVLFFGALSSYGQGTVQFGNVQVEQASTKYVSFNYGNILPGSAKVYSLNAGFYSNFSVVDSLINPRNNDSVRVLCSPDHNMEQKGLVYAYNDLHGVLAFSELEGQGTLSNPYYHGTRNKEGEDLKTALKTRLAQGYVSLGYNSARDAMYSSIDNSNGEVECVYTGKKARFNSRSGANSAGFNCEHTFPQGFFSSNDPMKSDIHHLFPTTTTSNSRRANDPFGLVSNPSWTDGGSKSGGGKFEPRDYHKGTAARAVLYFVLRYQDYSNFLASHESTLRSWVSQFPPSQRDKDRNTAIYARQRNRNPFVDYPVFLERMSSISGSAATNTRSELTYSLPKSSIDLDTVDGFGIERREIFFNSGTETFSVTIKGRAPDGQYDYLVKDHILSPGKIVEVKFRAGVFVLGVPTPDFKFSTVLDSLIVSTDISSIPQKSFVFQSVSSNPGSVSETNGQVEFKVFPNPVYHSLYVKHETQEKLEYRILNLAGQEVQSGELSESIPVNELNVGEYLLEITNQQGEKGIRKFQVER